MHLLVVAVAVVVAPAQAAPGPWTETVIPGGPPHYGFTPAEQDLFAGTKAGDAAVDYRVDAISGVKDTWIWDGRTMDWRQVSSVPQPSTDLSKPGDAYGGTAGTMPVWAGGQTFVYSGGRDYHTPQNPAIGYLAEMFVLGDDGTWSPAPCNPDCAPGPLDGGASATNGSDTLLFGGSPQAPGSLPEWNKVFRWNGTDWDELAVAGQAPAPRAAAGFVFDGRDFIVFGGGQNSPGVVAFGDTWRLRQDAPGSWRWERVCDECGPSPRFQMYAAGLYRTDSPVRGALVVGGYSLGEVGPSTLPFALSDQWRWDGERWLEVDAGVAPCEPPPFQGGAVTACLTDPRIPFTPYVASLPALGAAVWTAGSCTTWSDTIRPNMGCTRATHQVTLTVPPTPSIEPAVPVGSVTTPAAAVTPSFTG